MVLGQSLVEHHSPLLSSLTSLSDSVLTTTFVNDTSFKLWGVLPPIIFVDWNYCMFAFFHASPNIPIHKNAWKKSVEVHSTDFSLDVYSLKTQGEIPSKPNALFRPYSLKIFFPTFVLRHPCTLFFSEMRIVPWFSANSFCTNTVWNVHSGLHTFPFLRICSPFSISAVYPLPAICF